ncbi:MAG: hypothetical protein AB8B85_03065 [Paracoccaceae bacterium]
MSDRIFSMLAAERIAAETVVIDAAHLKAHCTAASLPGKGSAAASDVPGAA